MARDAVKALLTDNPELADRIYQKIKDELAARKAADRTDSTAEDAESAAVQSGAGNQVNA